MAKVWVLDTETKGTGARVAPLDEAPQKPQERSEDQQPGRLLPPKPRPRPPKAPEPRGPRKFKVVDALSRQVVAEGAGTRETVTALEGFRSTVDVSVYAWEEKPEPGRWRLLTLRERQALWDLRGR
jgi:hypothetical protein